MLILPYYLNTILLAEFTSIYQIILLYIVFFEFGLTVSYNRYRNIYKSVSIINSIMQILILTILFILPFTFFSNLLNNLVNINNTDIYNETMYWSVISLLAWMYLKSLLLSEKKFKLILIFSITILFIRIISLYIISINNNYISINNLFMIFFIFPFLIILFYLLQNHIKTLITFINLQKKYNHLNLIKSFKYRIKTYINYSLFTFSNNVIYTLMLKLIIIFLLSYNELIKLAEIGYAMTFIGIVSIFVMSLRNLYISKFKFTNKKEIINYINFIKSLHLKIFIFSITISLIISLLVYKIKPDYLSNDTVVYTFIIVFSTIYISYFSMLTLLAKTFKENILELKINITRLIVVFFIIIFFLKEYFLVSLILIYFLIPFFEFIFFRILFKKIENKVH